MQYKNSYLCERLALGTVQFGLPYGISNAEGKVTQEQAALMVNRLRESGIDTIDTAIGYGESEKVLGLIGVSDFKVISKLPKLPLELADVDLWVNQEVFQSLYRLNIGSLYALLLHNPDDLLGPNGQTLAAALEGLKCQGMVSKLGISLYSPDKLSSYREKMEIDIVQAPFNLMDRRLADSGWLSRLKSNGAEIHVRSVFLQGLLLMDRTSVPIKFSHWQSLFNKWHDWLDFEKASALETCLAFPLSFSEIDRVIVGANNLAQLNEIINATSFAGTKKLPNITCNDENLINPAHWICVENSK